jgi:hypothetical protein
MFEHPPIPEHQPVLILTHGLHYAGTLARMTPHWLELTDVVTVFEIGPMTNIEKKEPVVEYGEPTPSLRFCVPLVSIQSVIVLHNLPTCRRTA